MKKTLILILTLWVAVLSVKAQINTDRMLAIGRNALYFEDYVLSIQYFNQVIKAKPYLAEPYLFRAIAKFNLDDYSGAEADITACLERNPFLVYAYQCRGAARQSMRDYEGAIQDYTKGLEFRPEDKQMLINMGIAYIQDKKYDQAEQTIDRLLQVQPKYTQAYLTRGALFAEKGDTLKALADFNTSIDMDRYYAPAYGQRGLILYQMNELDSALADFNEAIRLDPRQIGYYINRGLVRYYKNDLRGTMADYNSVINMEANNVIARFNRGLLRAQVGDNNRAIEDFDVVIKLEPDNFMAIYNRALLREEVGDFRGAAEDITTVLDEYPNFLPGYYTRSEIKRKMKDVRGADQDYWYAYNLEQKLLKEKAQGNKVTGKDVLSGDETATADNDADGKTREKSDKDIAKFNRLVIYDKGEEEASKYNSEIRGRVQDKQVKIDLEPQFVITYYEKMGNFDNVRHFDKLIADFNKEKVLNMQLRATNKEAALSDDQAEYHFKSINDYSYKIGQNPTDENAYFGRAMDFMVLQDLSEAIADFDRVIALDSKFALAYFNRAVIRYKQLELENYRSSENSEFKDNMELSLNIQTGKTKNKLPAGQYPTKTIDDGAMKETKLNFEYEMIMKDYEMVIQINPDFVFAYFNKGNIRCVQKDFRNAILDYNEAIRRDPEFAEAYFNRGLTRLYLGDTEKGIADLSKAGELGIANAYGIIKRVTSD